MMQSGGMGVCLTFTQYGMFPIVDARCILDKIPGYIYI